MSPMILEPIWDHSTHEFDIRDMYGLSKVTDSLGQRHNSNESSRRAKSAGYNIHQLGYLGDHNDHQDFYRDSGHQNCYRNFSLESSLGPRWPPTTYNQGRGRSLEKLPRICCHHQGKLLNDVQKQKRHRSRIVKVVEEHGCMPIFHQLLPKVAPLPNDKKELVEWNNFVNQMTTTLLNLKGLTSPNHALLVL